APAGLPDGTFIGLHKVGERDLSLRILCRRDDTVPDLELGRIDLQDICGALQNIFAKFIRSDIESAALYLGGQAAIRTRSGGRRLGGAPRHANTIQCREPYGLSYLNRHRRPAAATALGRRLGGG